MKKLFLFLFLTKLVFSNKLSSQNFNLTWSEKYRYSKKVGYYDKIVGENSSFLYVRLISNKGILKSKKFKIALKALDKNTFKEKYTRYVYDRKEESSKKYKELDYFTTLVVNDFIYDFWTLKEKDRVELHVATFDSKLKPIKKLTKVYTLNKGESKKASKPDYFVISNDKTNSYALICAEPSAEPGATYKLEYKLINAELTAINQGKVNLPVSSKGESRRDYGSIKDFEYAKNGVLYLQNSISPTRDEYRELKKDPRLYEKYYTILSAIDIQSGAMNSYPIKFPGMYAQSCKVIQTKDMVEVIGFYTDLSKDPKGNDKHGLYFINLDAETLKEKTKKVNTFTKNQLDILFAKDKEDRKDRAGIFASKKKKVSEEESLPSNYIIEQALYTGDGDIVIFSSIMRNYTVRLCTTSGTGASATTNCRDVPYCDKSNITAFRLSPNGDIKWVSNLDRFVTYSGWYRYDLKVTEKNNKFYAIYGSAYQTTAEKKNRRSRKSRKQMSDKFEYGVFEASNGSYKKLEETINPINASKSEKKYVSALEIEVYNNTFYTGYYKLKYDPLKTAGLCLLNLVCLPTAFLTFGSDINRYGVGYIGKIVPK